MFPHFTVPSHCLACRANGKSPGFCGSPVSFPLAVPKCCSVRLSIYSGLQSYTEMKICQHVEKGILLGGSLKQDKSFVPPSTWILYIHPCSTVWLCLGVWASQREITAPCSSEVWCHYQLIPSHNPWWRSVVDGHCLTGRFDQTWCY